MDPTVPACRTPWPRRRIDPSGIQHRFTIGITSISLSINLVAVVCDELQQREGLPAGLHLEVELPRQPGLPDHDVAAGEPRQVSVVGLDLVALDLEEDLLGLAVIAWE